jgi:uncharacterized protein
VDQIKIGDNIFDVLVAVSIEEQERGLMGRDEPLPSMIFPYPLPRLNSFWMKGVKAPLDIVFCLRGKVSSIWHGEPHSTRVLGGHEPSDLVIELPADTCKTRGIKPGDPITLALSREAQFKLLMQKTGIIF